MKMDRDQRAEFAQRLEARFRQLRDDEDWTQDMLAAESGVPLRTVSDVLRGASVPNVGTLTKLGRAMGIEPTPMLEREKWPADVRVWLDMMGLFLAQMPEQQREAIMGEISRRLIGPSATPSDD